MTNPFISRYTHASVLIKTNAGNLFWVLLLMAASGLAILVLTIFGPGISGVDLLPILLGFVVLSLVALLLLTLGQFQIASWITFGSLLGVVSAVSLLSRSGSNEMDLFQATVLFFLGLMVLSAVGVGGLLTIVWVAAGTAVLVGVLLIPATDVNLGLTVAQWNAAFNPLVIGVIYAAGSFAGTILIIQSRRNLKLMQFNQEIIESTNQMLELTVVERTQSLRTILDSSGQGLFTFGPDFCVEPDYSQGCRTLFPDEILGLEADTLLFPDAPDTAKDFRMGLTLYFHGKSKAGVIFDLLEKETVLSGRTLEIEYREAGTGRILCVLSDVTVSRELAERNRADEARRNLVLKALGHKHFFAGLLAEAEHLFGVLRIYEDRPATAGEAGALLQEIHTFKGNCGFFGFTETMAAAHRFETSISDAAVLGEVLNYRELALSLKRAYYNELNVITEALGHDWLDEAGGIVVPRTVYDKVTKYISKRYPAEIRMIDVLEHYRKMPLRDLFSRFPFIAQATAEKLGKRVATMEIVGGDLRVVPDRLEGLVDSCVHLVNNMVDHGIELPYVREAQGKSPEGKLTLNILWESSSVVVQFVDDGQGISLPEIEARAKALGLLEAGATPSNRETLALLFAPGFSTRAEATEVSGRGIGLAAVRQEAERLGGRVEVQTKLNAGTTFEIILPLEVFANRRRMT